MSELFIDNLRLPENTDTRMLIRAGRIEALDPALRVPAGVPVLDAGGLTGLPGAIDMHVHFRTPGGEHKETLRSGAAAAVKGGTTTCADMPNTAPRTTTVRALADKMALAAGAPCNLLYNFGAEPDNLDEVRAAIRNPAVKALKIYLGPSTGQGGLAPEAARAHFAAAGALGLPVMVHAEDLDTIQREAGAHPHDTAHHHALRALEAELKAVRRALDWAREFNVRLYLAHVTSTGVLALVRDSGLGSRVFVEVCPHHLLLSTADIRPPLENRFKVNPPLRPEAERAALFAALSGLCDVPGGGGSGVGGSGGGGSRIDGLGSDHAPHTLAEKRRPYDEAPSGIPGVETLFPLALDWWRQGRIGLRRLLDLTSGNAARFFGLNKGRLEPGADADLVLVDPDRQWEVGGAGDAIASKCGWSVYTGRVLTGRPERTIVAGRLVYARAGPRPDRS